MPRCCSKTSNIRYQTSTNSDDDVIAIQPRSSKLSHDMLNSGEQAGIAAVAPGISEALFATAIGLFVAIPAVWAYNRFTTRVERLAVRYESFSEEFSSILQRQSSGDE